jgi:hypothetical protein
MGGKSEVGELNNLPSWLNAAATGFAAIAAFLAWRVQQSIFHREARRIVLDIYERFFTRDECRKIIREIEKDFEKKDYRKFWKRLCENPRPGELDETDLDEYLGYFELLGSLLRRKVIYFEDVYDLFGYYIENTWEHKRIQQDHIERLRQQSPDIYEQFQYLAGLVIAHSKKKAQEAENLTWRNRIVFYLVFFIGAMLTGVITSIGFWGIMQTNPKVAYAALAGAGLSGLLAVFASANWHQREREAGLAIEIADKNRTPTESKKDECT